ncbi:hypothetical protein GCM10023189_28950 [Nibrella saemangeumensis]|uniref:Secretion system C-terminal sorting domain-containing protein n=1 Tax=Nibrella saemangeumensis TaxID=1084526 RepID=A0ABP8N0C1_9BACT
MKKIIALMLGLVAGTASFAQQTIDQTPDVVITSANQKLHLYVAPQTANATIKLHDAVGHLLYVNTANAANGVRQTFNLTNLEAGTYRLSVVKDGQTTQKTVVVETVPAQKQITLEA